MEFTMHAALAEANDMGRIISGGTRMADALAGSLERRYGNTPDLRLAEALVANLQAARQTGYRLADEIEGFIGEQDRAWTADVPAEAPAPDGDVDIQFQVSSYPALALSLTDQSVRRMQIQLMAEAATGRKWNDFPADAQAAWIRGDHGEPKFLAGNQINPLWPATQPEFAEPKRKPMPDPVVRRVDRITQDVRVAPAEAPVNPLSYPLEIAGEVYSYVRDALRSPYPGIDVRSDDDKTVIKVWPSAKHIRPLFLARVSQNLLGIAKEEPITQFGYEPDAQWGEVGNPHPDAPDTDCAAAYHRGREEAIGETRDAIIAEVFWALGFDCSTIEVGQVELQRRLSEADRYAQGVVDGQDYVLTELGWGGMTIEQAKEARQQFVVAEFGKEGESAFSRLRLEAAERHRGLFGHEPPNECAFDGACPGWERGRKSAINLVCELMEVDQPPAYDAGAVGSRIAAYRDKTIRLAIKGIGLERPGVTEPFPVAGARVEMEDRIREIKADMRRQAEADVKAAYGRGYDDGVAAGKQAEA